MTVESAGGVEEKANDDQKVIIRKEKITQVPTDDIVCR